MTRQQSFSKAENDLLPKFRKMINEAESTEDVKKFFSQCMRELIQQVSAGQLTIELDDILLCPENEPPVQISGQLQERAHFVAAWNESDLPQIVSRFASIASHHHRHLAKNPEKTEAKIRM